MRIERFFRHRSVLLLVLLSMGIGLLKYQTHLALIVGETYYGSSWDMLSTNARHEEITRMPVEYGTGIRFATHSGE